ncbi:hypothetical protein EEB11_05820 [Pseudotabrizicola sediminis]|uniref:Uncharacterized protein n=1 Tax=Pseudotabrizicola sediminis TaxID=2486418 RepID=A0ABY2KNK1_9RHOB|nr:hypothetical protein [Pseudotabrizicola sediminis]TGD44210.1 hypothetical protein EEB11_05820 [Pseudotabrizicola sediminis]
MTRFALFLVLEAVNLHERGKQSMNRPTLLQGGATTVADHKPLFNQHGTRVMTLLPNQPSHSPFLWFWNDESGAVTIDWVVLTAGVVGLVLLVFTVFTPEVFDAAITAINGAMRQP